MHVKIAAPRCCSSHVGRLIGSGELSFRSCVTRSEEPLQAHRLHKGILVAAATIVVGIDLAQKARHTIQACLGLEGCDRGQSRMAGRFEAPRWQSTLWLSMNAAATAPLTSSRHQSCSGGHFISLQAWQQSASIGCMNHAVVSSYRVAVTESMLAVLSVFSRDCAVLPAPAWPYQGLIIDCSREANGLSAAADIKDTKGTPIRHGKEAALLGSTRESLTRSCL